MSLDCGIVGLQNVGKYTLFNCLTKTMAAEAENYPFCTVDPNVGIVNVVDEKLDKVSMISKSLKTVYSQVKIVDIAGLVKGASRGEGLGNKFLANIRETDAIIHVVRCFDNDRDICIKNLLSDQTIQNTLHRKELPWFAIYIQKIKVLPLYTSASVADVVCSYICEDIYNDPEFH